MLIGRPNSKFLVNARMHRTLDCTVGSSRENTTSKQNEMSNHYFCYTLTFIVYGRFDKAIFWCISDCFGRRHPFIWSSHCLRCDDNNRGCKFSLLLPWEWRYLRLRSIHIGFYSRNVCSFLWIDSANFMIRILYFIPSLRIELTLETDLFAGMDYLSTQWQKHKWDLFRCWSAYKWSQCTLCKRERKRKKRNYINFDNLKCEMNFVDVQNMCMTSAGWWVSRRFKSIAGRFWIRKNFYDWTIHCLLGRPRWFSGEH